MKITCFTTHLHLTKGQKMSATFEIPSGDRSPETDQDWLIPFQAELRRLENDPLFPQYPAFGDWKSPDHSDSGFGNGSATDHSHPGFSNRQATGNWHPGFGNEPAIHYSQPGLGIEQATRVVFGDFNANCGQPDVIKKSYANYAQPGHPGYVDASSLSYPQPNVANEMIPNHSQPDPNYLPNPIDQPPNFIDEPFGNYDPHGLQPVDLLNFAPSKFTRCELRSQLNTIGHQLKLQLVASVSAPSQYVSPHGRGDLFILYLVGVTFVFVACCHTILTVKSVYWECLSQKEGRCYTSSFLLRPQQLLRPRIPWIHLFSV
ncbi:hypothetical protein NHQ30_008332 [Ciborinia camelliae]|nr:hypothetical protein NHQ30_008332 [Ciborinia camelliae]